MTELGAARLFPCAMLVRDAGWEQMERGQVDTGKATSQSRASQIALRIQKDIEDGIYGVGTRLPTETQLMERFDSGRSTVREAMRMLVARGMVETRRGSGSYCISAEPSGFSRQLQSSDLEEIYEIRAIFEVGMVGLAARKRTDEDIAAIRESLAERKESIQRLDFEAYTQADIRFHAALAKATHNKILTDFFAEWTKTLEMVLNDDEVENGFDRNDQELHELIGTSVEMGNESAARAFMRQILENDLEWIRSC